MLDGPELIFIQASKVKASSASKLLEIILNVLFKISLFITTLLLSLLFTIFLELFLSRKLILFEKNKNINNI